MGYAGPTACFIASESHASSETRLVDTSLPLMAVEREANKPQVAFSVALNTSLSGPSAARRSGQLELTKEPRAVIEYSLDKRPDHLDAGKLLLDGVGPRQRDFDWAGCVRRGTDEIEVLHVLPISARVVDRPGESGRVELSPDCNVSATFLVWGRGFQDVLVKQASLYISGVVSHDCVRPE